MNDSGKDGKGDNGKRDLYVQVPRGWSRGLEKDSVFYMSPSSHCLRSKEELKEYLLSNVTCKCGLECPLHLDKIFNFDATLPSRHVKVNQCGNSEHRTMCKLSMGTVVGSTLKETIGKTDTVNESSAVTDHPISGKSNHTDLPSSKPDVKMSLPTFETFTSPPEKSNGEKETVKTKKVVINQSKKRKADNIVSSGDGCPTNKIQQSITVHSTSSPISHSHAKGSIPSSNDTTASSSMFKPRVAVTTNTKEQSMYGINSILPFPSSHMNASSYLASLSSNVPTGTHSSLQNMESSLRGINVSQTSATSVGSLLPGQKSTAPTFSTESSSNVLYLPGVNMVSNTMNVNRTSNLQSVSLGKASGGHPMNHQAIPLPRTLSTTKVPSDTHWYPPASFMSTASTNNNHSDVISGGINTVTKLPTHQIKDLLSLKSDGTPVNILPLVTTSGNTSGPSTISKTSETPGAQPVQYCSILLQPTSNMVPQSNANPRSTNPAPLSLQNVDQLAGLNMLPMSSNANNSAVLGMSPFLPYVLGIAPNGGTRPVTIQSKMPKSSTSTTTESTAGSEDAVAAAYSAFVSIAPAAGTPSMSQHLMNFVSNYSHPYWQQLLGQGASNPLAYQLLQMNQLSSLHASQSGSLKTPKYTASQQQSKHSSTTSAGNYVSSVLGKQTHTPHGSNTSLATSHGSSSPKVILQRPIMHSIASPVTVSKVSPSANVLNRTSAQGSVKQSCVTTTLTQTNVPVESASKDYLRHTTKSLGRKDVRPTVPGVDFQPQMLAELSGIQTTGHGSTNPPFKKTFVEGTAGSATNIDSHTTQYHITHPSMTQQSTSKTPTTRQTVAPLATTQHSITHHHPNQHQTTIQHPTTRHTTTHQPNTQPTTRELLLRNILSRCSASPGASVSVEESISSQEAIEIKKASASSTGVKLPTSTVDSCSLNFDSGSKSTDGGMTKDNKQSDRMPSNCEKQRLLKSVTLHYGNTTSPDNRTMADGPLLASDVLKLAVCNYQKSAVVNADRQKLESDDEQSSMLDTRLSEPTELLSRSLRNDGKELLDASKHFVDDKTTSLTDAKSVSLEKPDDIAQLQECDNHSPESEKGTLSPTNTRCSEKIINPGREQLLGHHEPLPKECDVTEQAPEDKTEERKENNDQVSESLKPSRNNRSLGHGGIEDGKLSDDITEHCQPPSNTTLVETGVTHLTGRSLGKDVSESNEQASKRGTMQCNALLPRHTESPFQGSELLLTHIKEEPLHDNSVLQGHNKSSTFAADDRPCASDVKELCQTLSNNIDKNEDTQDRSTSVQSGESCTNVTSSEADKISENSEQVDITSGQRVSLSNNVEAPSNVPDDNIKKGQLLKNPEHSTQKILTSNLRVSNKCDPVDMTEYVVHNTGVEKITHDNNDNTCQRIERTTNSNDVIPNEINDEECHIDSKDKEQSKVEGSVMYNGETRQSTSTEIKPINSAIDKDEDFFDPINFTIGDIVWAQARGLPSWPGKIVDEQDVGSGQADDGKRWVMWFGDHTFSQVEIEKLKTLTDGLKTLDDNKGKKRKYRGKKSRKGLEQAIGEALEEMEERENPRARQAFKAKRRRLRP